MIEMLLGRGADANAQDNEGDTPLMVAARNGLVDAVRILVERADVTMTNNAGQTAADLTTRNDIRALLEVRTAKHIYAGSCQ
jgi:uncharacterized protein